MRAPVSAAAALSFGDPRVRAVIGVDLCERSRSHVMPSHDHSLLERWLDRRDAEAFDELVSRYAGLVFATSQRVVRNEADAEDVAQNCFLKLARVKVLPRSSLGAWLHRVATRDAIDVVRARERRRRRERSFACKRGESGSEPTWSEIEEHVDECIAELPDPLRATIVAHFLDRKTQEEIASDLGVSRQAVSYRVRKGVERLRALLARRGVSASVGALGALLGAAPVEAAAPSTLLASLGRVALSGIAAPPVTPAAAAGAASGSVVPLGGVLMGKKLAISAGLALALVLTITGIAYFSGGADHHDDRADRSPVEDPARIDQPRPERPAEEVARVVQPRSSSPSDVQVAASDIEITGVVLSGDGEAVGGASVAVGIDSGEALRAAFRAETDRDGRFRLPIPEGVSAVHIGAFSGEFGLGGARVDEPNADAELEITLVPLCAIGGRVFERESEAGLAGLRLRLAVGPTADDSAAARSSDADAGRASVLFPEVADVATGAAATTVTNDEGLYRFFAIGPLRADVRFDAVESDYVVPGLDRTGRKPPIELAAGERRLDVDFALTLGGALRGVVLEPDGTPSAGSKVELVASFPTRARRLTCDDEGRFSFRGLATGANYVVQATQEGYAPTASESIALSAVEELSGIEIVLRVGAFASGRFIEEGGTPVSGLRVSVERPFEASFIRSGFDSIVTSDLGEFSIGPLAPGTYRLRPSTEAHNRRNFSLVMPDPTPPDSGDVEGLEFELARRAEGYIAGRVIDDEGRGVRAVVAVRRRGRLVERSVSGDDGAFRVDGLEEADDYLCLAQSSVHLGERVKNISTYTDDLVLLVRRRGRISARILDAVSGEPVAHCEVRVAFRRPDGNTFHTKWTPYDDPDGRIAIDGAESAPVQCQLHVRSPEHVSAKSSRFEVPPGGTSDEIEVRLERGPAIRGRIVDAESGEALEGVRVRSFTLDAYRPSLLNASQDAWGGDDLWKLGMSDVDGRFELRGYEAGSTIHIVAWKSGYGTVIRRGVRVVAGGVDTELALGAEGGLVVQARFNAGERYVFTALHREQRPWRNAFFTAKSATKPGPVEILGLPPGRYRLVVDRAEGKRSTRVGEIFVQIDSGDRHELELELDPDAPDSFARRFGSIAGSVAGVGDPTRVRVDLVPKSDLEDRYSFTPTLCNADGSFQLTGVPAGAYLVIAREGGRNAREVRVEVRVDARRRADARLVFE